jgi:hypothetical protein
MRLRAGLPLRCATPAAVAPLPRPSRHQAHSALMSRGRLQPRPASRPQLRLARRAAHPALRPSRAAQLASLRRSALQRRTRTATLLKALLRCLRPLGAAAAAWPRRTPRRCPAPEARPRPSGGAAQRWAWRRLRSPQPAERPRATPCGRSRARARRARTTSTASGRADGCVRGHQAEGRDARFDALRTPLARRVSASSSEWLL